MAVGLAALAENLPLSCWNLHAPVESHQVARSENIMRLRLAVAVMALAAVVMALAAVVALTWLQDVAASSHDHHYRDNIRCLGRQRERQSLLEHHQKAAAATKSLSGPGVTSACIT
jgi:hypothetical protein